MSAHTASKPLHDIATDRCPWSYNSGTGDSLVAGEPLTGFERIIVIQVSRHPDNFKDPAGFVREGEKPLSSWERKLVDAARKFPVNLAPIADWYPEYFPSAKEIKSSTEPQP